MGEETQQVIVRPSSSLDIAALALAADEVYKRKDIFQDYWDGCSHATQLRKENDLLAWVRYIHAAHGQDVQSPTDADLRQWYQEVQRWRTLPTEWRNVTFGMVAGFRDWLKQEGYAMTSISAMLATVRKYCQLVGPAPEGVGLIDTERLHAILAIRVPSGRKAANEDESRVKAGIPTRRGAKKEKHTTLTTYQALQLKKTTFTPEHTPTRTRDTTLSARDALLVGLMVEHALRCGEVAALNIESIDLVRRTIHIWHEKTNDASTQALSFQHTLQAAERYLAEQKRTQGPLFIGYRGQRLTKRAINHRIGQIGRMLGIEKLSPHDLRHFWAFDALANGTPFNAVQKGGHWKKGEMVHRYAEQIGIANEGVKITEA